MTADGVLWIFLGLAAIAFSGLSCWIRWMNTSSDEDYLRMLNEIISKTLGRRG